MKKFGQHYRQLVREDLQNLTFDGNEKKFALDLLSDIMTKSEVLILL